LKILTIYVIVNDIYSISKSIVGNKFDLSYSLSFKEDSINFLNKNIDNLISLIENYRFDLIRNIVYLYLVTRYLIIYKFDT